MSANDFVSGPAGRVLLVTRILDAPRDLVYKVWTDPKHLAKWWGPRDFTSPSCRMNVEPGGFYRIHIISRDGKAYWMQGVYKEVVKPERLVFTFSWDTPQGTRGHETLVTVLFEESEGKTKFTFHQAVFESDSARNDHDKGWTETFDKLEAYLAKA